MRRLRETLLARGQGIAESFFAANPVLEPVWPAMAVLLAGSGMTEFIDEYSGIDLLVLCPEAEWSAARTALDSQGENGDGLPEGNGPLEETVRARSRGIAFKYRVLPYETARHRLGTDDQDELFFALWNAHVLHDPTGAGAALIAAARQVPPAVWGRKAVARYREFRRRKASLAWSLRRGQPVVVLDNLMQLLDQVLAFCCCLENHPAGGRKWALRAALHTPVGQELRPVIFELFSSLGGVAVLGGSFNLRYNHLYHLISQIQTVMERAMRDQGWGNPAAEEAGDEAVYLRDADQ